MDAVESRAVRRRSGEAIRHPGRVRGERSGGLVGPRAAGQRRFLQREPDGQPRRERKVGNADLVGDGEGIHARAGDAEEFIGGEHARFPRIPMEVKPELVKTRPDMRPEFSSRELT